MSASEKLRALDSDRRYWPRNSGQRELYEHTIADALPLIADCVQALEEFVAPWNPDHYPQLRGPLNALTEHLEGGDE